MTLNFNITFGAVEYEIEGNYTPSDKGDSLTPASGDCWEVTDVSIKGESVDVDFTPAQEDMIYEEAVSMFWEYYGEDPNE